jgi:hypothetical protein
MEPSVERVMTKRVAGLMRRLSWVGSSILRTWQLNQCPAFLPWFDLGAEEMGRLHRLALSLVWTIVPSRSARLVLAFSAAVWPARAFAAAVVQLWHHGRTVSRAGGAGRGLQFGRMLWLAIRRNVAPVCFYKFRLWDDSEARRASLYIQDSELAVLQVWMKRSPDDQPLDDKVQVFEACRAHGIPTAPVVAEFREGAGRWFDEEEGLWPASDLFVKWVNLYGGAGAESWSYDVAGARWHLAGEELDGEALLRRVRSRSMARPVVVQQRLRNHPDTARFTLGGLCTLRVVTYRSEGEPAQVGFACLRMPTGRSVVDNFAAGGLAAGVDPETGILGPAVSKRSAVGSLASHPDTGARISGERLASWRELLDLALRAHECFREPWSIGWDMAMTPEGPVVVEGNTVWSGDLLQMTLGPIGEAPFGRAFHAEISRRLAA